LSYADQIFLLGEQMQEALLEADSTRTRLTVGISDSLPKLTAYRLLEIATQLPRPVRLVCYEGEFDELLADLALHKLDVVLTDRAVRSGTTLRVFSHLLSDSETIVVGAPGLPDQAYERRVDQWAGELDTLEPPQMAAVVGRVVRERPDDRRALAMLGVARFQADDPLGAASAFRRLVELEPTDAQAWARLGESLVRANDGRVGADAEAAFREAVRHDPDQLGARFFLGEAALVRGDAAETRAQWTPLIAALDPADPRRQDLERRLPRVE
jgi:cytochrome c-type biogenesis protein CcmH/NrfG